MDDSQILEFLKEFRQGKVWKALQIEMFEEKMGDEEIVRTPFLPIEKYSFSQGRINGLEFNPVDSLIEKLEAKLKQKES